jgi:DNA-binding LacI/PurR family transcriptional regulator
MPVRMKDIAKRAGVSLSTVSVVLSGSRRLAISEDTRQTVLALANELNYRPNPHARNLARGSSNLVGVVISEIANPFFPEIIRSFESAAAIGGQETLLFNTEYDSERARSAVSKMVVSNVAGVAIFTSKFERELIDQLLERQIPIVQVQSSEPERGVATLKIEFRQGISEALQHLMSLGHRRVGAITGPAEIPSATSYARNLTEAAAQLGIEVVSVVSCNYRHDAGMRAVRTLFGEGEFPSAILCANDLIAMGAVNELERVGLRVPEDISVVGFDDLVFAHLSRPPLTTVAVQRAEVGAAAFDLLARMRESGERNVPSISIVPRLVIRQSTAPPPAEPRQLESRHACSGTVC